MSKEKKKEYQREYMKRKRSNGIGVRPIKMLDPVRPNKLDPVIACSECSESSMRKVRGK